MAKNDFEHFFKVLNKKRSFGAPLTEHTDGNNLSLIQLISILVERSYACFKHFV